MFYISMLLILGAFFGTFHGFALGIAGAIARAFFGVSLCAAGIAIFDVAEIAAHVSN